MTIKALGYGVIEATDVSKWDAFLCEVVGLMKAGKSADGGNLYRVDDRIFRLCIQSGEQDRLLAAGYELTSGTFDSTVQILRDARAEVMLASEAEAKARGVTRLARASDPAGNGLEFYCGDTQADTPFVSLLGMEQFVTGDMGLGHVVFAAPEFEKSHAFYEAIGFNDTDLPSFQLMGPDGPTMHFAFMHAANGRHHSIAIGEMPPTPAGCVHVMLEVGSMDDMGRAFDRVLAAGHPVSATIGKHTNDEVTGFYVQTPGGFDLEIGYAGLVIDPEKWVPTAHDTVSQWGHAWAWQEEMKRQMNAAGGNAN
jgi:3,4-dihydroxy-9,10-secoandrosta-1,3,5(10)-triene-9,17-dione 4,5-dioxygenase